MVLCLFYEAMEGIQYGGFGVDKANKISFCMILADSYKVGSLVAVIGGSVAPLLMLRWHEISINLGSGFASPSSPLEGRS